MEIYDGPDSEFLIGMDTGEDQIVRGWCGNVVGVQLIGGRFWTMTHLPTGLGCSWAFEGSAIEAADLATQLDAELPATGTWGVSPDSALQTRDFVKAWFTAHAKPLITQSMMLAYLDEQEVAA